MWWKSSLDLLGNNLVLSVLFMSGSLAVCVWHAFVISVLFVSGCMAECAWYAD